MMPADIVKNAKDSSDNNSLFAIRNVKFFLFVLFFGLFAFGAGLALGANGYQVTPAGLKVRLDRSTPPDKKDLDFSLFWRVWDMVKNSYFDNSKISETDMFFGAIKGMVSAVGDPYTVFLTPDENKIVREDLSGNFEGIGIQIGFKGSQLAVIAPLPDSPAEAAGIRAGDIIAVIKDKEKNIDRGTVGMSLPDAVQLIRGKAGSVVTLTLIRDGEKSPIIVDVVRKTINVPSVTLDFIGPEKNIAHIKVLKFGGETLSEWGQAILNIQTKQGLEGIIVDLRNNPGGYLQGAVDLGSEFLQEGQIVVVEEYANGSKNEFFVEKSGKLNREKLVVLVNDGSASASEILAGALRDIKKTPIVGTVTFGKGTVQEAKELESGTGLHITVARWLTPSGFWVNGNGLSPDYEVEDNPETIEDEQLSKAVEVLKNINSLTR